MFAAHSSPKVLKPLVWACMYGAGLSLNNSLGYGNDKLTRTFLQRKLLDYPSEGDYKPIRINFHLEESALLEPEEDGSDSKVAVWIRDHLMPKAVGYWEEVLQVGLVKKSVEKLLCSKSL